MPLALFRPNLPPPFASFRRGQGRTDIAIFGDHNRAYYYWHKALEEGDVKKGGLLIHFDTHDDMQVSEENYLPPRKEAPTRTMTPEQRLAMYDRYADELEIPSFIAPAVYEGLFSEIYWVLPDWAPRESKMGQNLWIEDPSNEFLMELRRLEKIEDPTLRQKSRMRTLRRELLMLGPEKDITIYFGRKKGPPDSVYFSPLPPEDGECVGEVRTIVVHKVYKEQLPDFSAERRSLFIDMDQDWINNTGYDTPGHLDPQLTLDQAREVARGFVRMLQEKNIRPGVITIAASPEYTYSDQVDDTTAVLVEELMKQRIVERPEFIEGKPSYSENTYSLASSLKRFVEENRERDPRLHREVEMVSVASFNRETAQINIPYFPENDHERHEPIFSPGVRRIFNRAIPSPRYCQETERSVSRLDYGPYIDFGDRFGLVNLSAVVRHLQWMQAQEDASPDEMERAYNLVLETLKPILTNNQ